MMKKIFKRSIECFLIIYLVLPFGVNAEVITYGQVLDDLTKAEAELKQNQQSISSGKNQINVDNATIKSLIQEIEEMSIETDKLKEEIADANTEIDKKKEQTKSIVSYLQMSGGENLYLEYVFGTETITDLVYRLAVVEQITEYNEKVVKDLEKLISSNETKKKELADKETKYQAKITNLKSEINKLHSQISALGDLSPGLEQEVKTKKERAEYYKQQGCKNRGDRIGIDCATTTSNAYFTRPIQTGYVTSFTGYRWGSLHRGIDLGSSLGRNTPLYSIGFGVITSIWQDGSGAQCVNVEYKTTSGTYYTAIYGHLSKYGNIYTGMKVTPDTVLGYMGDTGYAFGVHLHLEVWPCRLYADSNCRTWNDYTNFARAKFNSGYKGAESVINFPSRAYQTWYTK